MIKVYGKFLDQLSTEDLNNRLKYLRRNENLYQSSGIPALEQKRREEEYEIEKELSRRV